MPAPSQSCALDFPKAYPSEPVEGFISSGRNAILIDEAQIESELQLIMGLRKQLLDKTIGYCEESSLDDENDKDSDERSSESDSPSEDDKKKKKDSKAKSRSPKKKKTTKSQPITAEQLVQLLSSLKPSEVAAAPAPAPLPSPPPPPPPPPNPDTLDLSSVQLASALNATDIARQVVQLLSQQVQDNGDKNKPMAKSGSKLGFKRLDHVYDRKIHNYKLKETVKADPKRDEWDQYVFTVRRQFDSASHYLGTFVDIKSKILHGILKDVMGEIKGMNLFTEKPSVDPKMLFLYLEELRELHGKLNDAVKTIDNKKEKKSVLVKTQHLKILIDYLDEDYADTKKALYPMLEAGVITFDYLWALFKPNTILLSHLYGDEEERRAFKTVLSKESISMTKGKWYSIEAQYLDYDGKHFGKATGLGEVPYFTGARKIASLPCYPIQYHKNCDEVRAELVERGKKFVALQGANYKNYAGMCYVKKDDGKVLKVDVRGRIMIDPAIFRRTNPNYHLSIVKPIKDEVAGDVPPSTEDTGDATTSSDSKGQPTPDEDFDEYKQFQVVEKDGRYVIVEAGSEQALEIATENRRDIFTEEQLLIASPVVLGFSFSEKLWLEFAVSKIGEVVWNSDAFDSLILPDNQKNIVKAMVSSHVSQPSKSIDDIIAGKGKGLVAVLHGGPGLGKTLTVESIADLLKRPLYMVSAGDLGVNSSTLEHELQKILDIAHAWNAVLLLDEADVFLEKRSTHDIQRNALVSIFLRLLEYFQGILFLTTNRVDVFDDAFISRIHLSLRYGELSTKARKAVWKTFFAKVRDTEGMQVEAISEKELDGLSRIALNGRQIKNIVRTAQALAIHSDIPLGMEQVREVLGVAQAFERDLKGGTGFEEAMRGYT